MKDWAKAIAVILALVTVLSAAFLCLLHGFGTLLDPPGYCTQDYLSPDGNYVATVRTEVHCLLSTSYYSSVLVHPVAVSTADAIKANRRYEVLGGNCSPGLTWKSCQELQIDVGMRSGNLATYKLASMDASHTIVVQFATFAPNRK